MLHDACNPHDIIDRNRYTWRLKVDIKQSELQCFPLYIKGNKFADVYTCAHKSGHNSEHGAPNKNKKESHFCKNKQQSTNKSNLYTVRKLK